MIGDQLIIRSSPFQFLKRLVTIEFLFALLPFFLAWVINLIFNSFSETYERLPFANSFSFNFFTAIVFTTAQVVIIAIAFFSWYFPVYIIDLEAIVYQRGDILGDKKLAQTKEISDISVKKGRLAQVFNYGNLLIQTTNNPDHVTLKDITDPQGTAEKIEGLLNLSYEMPSNLIPQSVNELIDGGEHQFVEFKSSFVWDYYQQRANKALHEPIMKTIAAFLNSSGGYLLIGIDDEGQVLGLDHDLQTLGKPNLDGFENSFNLAFNKMIGVEFRQYVELAFPTIQGKSICAVQVQPSHSPAYLQYQDTEKFFIRAGNASQPLTISQSNRYIQRRFK